MELWDCRHLLVFYDVVDSVIRFFYTDLSLLTLLPLIVVMKTMLLLWLAYVIRVKLWKLKKLIKSSLWWNISCLHFTGVVYYPALIMIWCDMFTSISLLTVRVGSILHGFCTAHVRCQSAYHRNDYKYYFYEIHTSISTFLGNRFSVKRKKN